MSSFSEQVLQEKLSRLTVSQDSIETLSSWIIHHRTHAAVSVTKWLQNIHQGDMDRQMLLLYLANDVLQNSRRKNLSIFHELFKEPLKVAASLACGHKNEKICVAFIKILNLWKERRIYDAVFLNELETMIEPVKQEKSKTVRTASTDFKLSLLEDSLTELQKFEGEMKVKSNGLLRLSIDVSNTDSLSKLKDRSAGGKFEADFESASRELQEYLECVGIEVNERRNLLDMLYQCKHYHVNKTKELRGLLKDYGNIRNHFQQVKTKLKDRIVQLEKASHTATSDPTSKQDITVAGDMEIDTDDEQSQEDEQPHPLPVIVPPILPPPLQFPHFTAGNYPYSPSQPHPHPHNLPHPHPLSNIIPHPPIPYSPSMPKRFSPLIPSPNISSFPPFPPRSFPPINNDHRQQKDLVQTEPAMSLLPNNTNTNTNTTTDIVDTSHSDIVDITSQSDSIDDRLKYQKTLPLSLFQDYSDSDSDNDDINNKPYSPSSLSTIPSTVSIVKDECGGTESLPIPTVTPPIMTPPPPDYVTFSTGNVKNTNSISMIVTPTPAKVGVSSSSLDNPILTTPILYTKPATPTNYPSSTAPTNYLKPTTPTNYPDNTTPIINDSTSHNRNTLTEAVQHLASSISASSAINTPQVAPENIKITSTLTTLLDKIFPQLSQSLQSDRKRKQDVNNEEPDTKAPRVETYIDKSGSNTEGVGQFQPNIDSPSTTANVQFETNTERSNFHTPQSGSYTPQQSGSYTLQSGSNNMSNIDHSELTLQNYEQEILNISKNVELPKPQNYEHHTNNNANIQSYHPNYVPPSSPLIPLNYHVSGPQMYPPRGITMPPRLPVYLPPHGGGRPPRFPYNQPPLRPHYY